MSEMTQDEAREQPGTYADLAKANERIGSLRGIVDVNRRDAAALFERLTKKGIRELDIAKAAADIANGRIFALEARVERLRGAVPCEEDIIWHMAALHKAAPGGDTRNEKRIRAAESYLDALLTDIADLEDGDL